MKTTKRGKLLMLACAALVAVLACLPLLWFRAQDARMFGTVNQSSGLYESREVSGDDFYLLQQVKNRTQMNRVDDTRCVIDNVIITASNSETNLFILFPSFLKPYRL